MRKTVLVVGDSSIDMRTFIRRVRMSGRQPLDVLQMLVNEEIIKQLAPRPPFSIEAGEREVDAFLRELARGGGESLGEADFREWYRQRLNESGLSSAEFRDLVRTQVLARSMTEVLSDRVPTVAEQVRLLMIPLKEPADAGVLKERLRRGESFETLARELSADAGLRDRGGDAGWFPRGALAPELADAAFDGLEVGEVSGPISTGDQTVVLMVAERSAAREIDGESLARLRAAALEEWVREEYKHQRVEFHGFRNGYDSETDAWVKWQVARRKR
jgi:hypothetical protein